MLESVRELCMQLADNVAANGYRLKYHKINWIYLLSLESKHSILDFVFQKNAGRQNLKMESQGSRLLSSTGHYIVAMMLLSIGHSLKW